MRGHQTPLISGILLTAIVSYLIYYFSFNGMWNAATVIITIILGMLATGQFIIWNMFFKKSSRKEPDNVKDNEGTNSARK